MKLRIGYKQPSIKGYIHVDPFPATENVPSYNGTLDTINLDGIVDNNECTEIVAGELVSFVSVENIFAVLNHICMKLRHGGRITVGGIDARMLALGIFNGGVDPAEFNKVIFAEGHKSILPMNDIALLLARIGLTVTSRELNGVNYLITAERP